MTRGWIIALCAGCSLPSATFTGDGDGGIDAPFGPRIDLSTSSLQAGEAVPGMFMVQLGQPPMNAVTVSIVSAEPTIGVTPNMLTFSAADWSTPEIVTVLGVEDADAIHLMSSLSFSAPGYDDTSLAVTIEDNDLLNAPVSVGICFDTGPGMVPVVLDSAPLATTMVSISNSSPGIVGIDRTSLTFTPSDFNRPQMIRVTPLDSAGGGAMITLSAAGQTPRTITVNVGASGKCV